MKRFNLEAARQGAPVCTRDGHKARIICFDRKEGQPIVALVEGEYRCKDCKHYVKGFSSNSAWFETNVCELLFKRTTKEGRPCYKAVNKYNLPCDKFEHK